MQILGYTILKLVCFAHNCNGGILKLRNNGFWASGSESLRLREIMV